MGHTNEDYIKKYYEVMGITPIISDSLASIFQVLLPGKNRVLVSENKILRGCGRIKGIERPHIDTVNERAIQFFALEDAFSLLAQKGVPVYYYNRIGEKEGFIYSPEEQHRMQKGLSFPAMYQDIDKYEIELRDVFGRLYSKEYVKAMGQIPQVIRIGNAYLHEDCHSKLINVENGKRVTLQQPQEAALTIHVYGRCGVFGYAVEDKDSLPSLLQEKFNEKGISVCVVNHGLWGGVDEYLDHNFLQDAVGMKQGDIVLFYRKHFNKKLLCEFIKRGVRYKEITDEWHAKKCEEVTFFDRPGHMNAAGYNLVAELISEDMIVTGFTCGNVDQSVLLGTADHLNYYLKTRINKDFEQGVAKYIAKINKDFPLSDKTIDNGAIVMNCNPFTYGHRYLIETASKQVDRLYIFVVQEDKSFFNYEDRFIMVKNGTKDIDNVVIVPSGEFIISAYTFPEYFMKDYVKEKNFDVSMDIDTFCKYIAPPLRISKRFAGEEPFDPVTKNYNENMSTILPKYGMQFIEVPRYSLDSGRIINATKVRKLLKEKEFDELKDYVPESTFELLIEKYVG